MADIILPGTYINVKDEGLISAGAVAAGIIGVVGSIENTEKNKDKMNKVKILGSLSEAEEAFGAKGTWATDPKDAAKNKALIQKNLTLVRALEQIYRNGGKSVYAVPTATNDSTAYKAGLAALANEIVNIVVLAGQDASDKAIVAELQGHLTGTAQIKRERIGLIGCNGTTDVAAIQKHELNSDRLIYVAPGMTATDVDPKTRAKAKLTLTGGYTAAAVAGRISSLPVQSSPTNKTLTLEGLNVDFSSSQLEPLVQKRVCMVEKREGYRIVKGITTATHSAQR